MSDLAKVSWVPRKYNARFGVNEMDAFAGVEGAWHISARGLMAGPYRNAVCTIDRVADYITCPAVETGQDALIVNTNGGVQKFYTLNLTTGVTTYVIDSPAALGAIDLFTSRVLSGFYNYIAAGGGVLKLFTPGPPSVSTLAGTASIFHITEHLSRLVGIDINDTLYWSVPGNYDDWTSTNLGAGSLNVNITNDYLRSVEVLRNQLVLLSYKRILIGYTTGIAAAPYRIEEYYGGKTSDVCTDKATVCKYNNILLYRGRNSFYRFEDGKQYPIGGQEIITYLDKETTFHTLQCVIAEPTFAMPAASSVVQNWAVREPYYVVAPVRLGGVGNMTMPMWGYNIRRDSWTVLAKPTLGVNYNNYRGVFVDEYLTRTGPMFLNADYQGVYQLSKTASADPTDLSVKIYTPPILVGESYKDYILERILIKYINGANGVATPPTINVDGYCTLDGSVVNFTTVNKTLKNNAGTSVADQTWIDMRGSNTTGQFFVFAFTFNLSAGVEFQLIEMDFFFSEAGDLRGY